MSQRDPMVRIRHMLDYAREAAIIAKNRSREDLDDDRLFYLALTRLVELIGEAASQVPHETQSQYPQIPWRSITGMRNRLIHGYDDVNMDLLWDTISDDISPLIKILETIVPPQTP